MDLGPKQAPPRKLDRYAIFDEIASGGMATVHLGRLLGPVGFSRTVAIKRMHPHLASQPDFVTMFLDEARLAARIRHPNVVSILDVVSVPGELALVMEFVQGEALDRLLRTLRERGERVPPHIACTIAAGILHGLHAAHEATNEHGEPLGIVHRDVSPQNVLVGTDGVSRVVDFGIAKAEGRLSTTREGQLKGKLMYMSPEQALHEDVDRRTDVFAAGIVLWEMLVGKRLFEGIHEAAILAKVLGKDVVKPPSRFDPSLVRLDRVVMRALAHEPDQRYPTARAMVVELERVWSLATPTEIGGWVEQIAGATITRRTERMRAVERVPLEDLPSGSIPPPPPGSFPPAASGSAPTVVEGRRAPPSGPGSGSGPSGRVSHASAVAAHDTVQSSGSGSSWTSLEGSQVRSQVSSISVSRSAPAPPLTPPSSRRLWVATIGGSVVAGALLAVVLQMPWRTTDGPSSSASQASSMDRDGSSPSTLAPVETTVPSSVAPLASNVPAPPATVVDEEALSPPRPEPSGKPTAKATSGKPRPGAATAAPSATARATTAPTSEKPTDYGF